MWTEMKGACTIEYKVNSMQQIVNLRSAFILIHVMYDIILIEQNIYE